MKTVISFRPGVKIQSNSIKVSPKQSLEKLSTQNDGFVAVICGRHFIFCFSFFVFGGITPLKVLVIDCKGTFFLQLTL